LALAPLGWMATLPVVGYVVGGALSTGLVARSQSRLGRKASFQIGLAVAVCSSLLCAWAVVEKNFWLLVLGTVIAGYYSANAQLYRFAAAELAKPAYREKAVSLVLAGGLMGAVLGPALAINARHLLSVPFAGAYLVLGAVALMSMATLAFITFPPTPAVSAASGGRPLREIMRQPVFIVSIAAASLGYGVMNLLMSATPLAMQQCNHPFEAAALVVEWHVIGMFAPGFFTGHLIRRFGAMPILWAGVALNVACIALALSGVEVMRFLAALVLLGVGWNFLFTGGTALALQSYRPEEKDKAQAAINFIVFAVMALSSFSAGALVTTQGWNLLNWGSLFPVGLIAVSLLWYSRWQRNSAA
ncbi:MAG: MFS transporter, partial [Lacisediminimonas sp.]|nr:MFS transporter [Lacisediminimonas sp.]